MKLSDFTTLSFDCYGTLIDWETGMLDALMPLTYQVSPAPDRNDILAAHGEAETLQQQANPTMAYAETLAVVYRRLAERWRIPVSWDECLKYGRSVGRWDPFPDTVDALAYLAEHYQLVILSNVDNDLFAETQKKLRASFDAVFTAQDIGSYKPDQRNFQYMLGHLEAMGTRQDQILHTAQSLYHDHEPAAKLGFARCWIHRRFDKTGPGATPGLDDAPAPNFTFNSLAELVDAHRAEMAQPNPD
ncbi:MAG: haloacid dehalogenase type II [Pseudomonadota bacterium]